MVGGWSCQLCWISRVLHLELEWGQWVLELAPSSLCWVLVGSLHSPVGAKWVSAFPRYSPYLLPYFATHLAYLVILPLDLDIANVARLALWCLYMSHFTLWTGLADIFYLFVLNHLISTICHHIAIDDYSLGLAKLDIPKFFSFSFSATGTST